jgi:hypothetical protein
MVERAQIEDTQIEDTVAGALKITCVAADNVNVAFYQNAVPIIRDLGAPSR